MATITQQSETQSRIGSVLSDLRRRIGRYVLIEGCALVLIAMGLVFWLTLGLDAAWFGFRKLELPIYFRGALMIGGVVLLLVLFAKYVVLRMSGNYGDKDLALVLERRFPELNDGLVTAVELSGTSEVAANPTTTAMLDRTVAKVSANVGKLPMESVFAMKPLRMAVVGAVAMLISVCCLGIAKGDTLARWCSAFVSFDRDYWDRDTKLRVRAVVQPGDRLREFRMSDESADNGLEPALELLHPRNTDLTILIECDDSTEKEWVVPDRVRLDLKRPTDRKRVYLSQLDEGKFRYSIDKLNDDIEFNIQGGDFANQTPFRIRVVDPPRIDNVTLECDYPEYTGWNETHPRSVSVTGTQAELPLETEFEFVAVTNKPLVGFHVEVGDAELTLEDGEAVLKVGGGENGELQKTFQLSPEVTAGLIAEDKKTIRLPLVITSLDGESSSTDRIRIRPESMLRFYLHDADDIISAEPIVLRVMGLPDAPPAVDCERKGVGDAITRQARVPIGGLITDDYGIANARFEYKEDDAESWVPYRFSNPWRGRPVEFRLQGKRDVEGVESFRVLDLDLKEGQKLTLSVRAEDADTIHGPNVGRSQKFEFRVVSNEELLSLLYAREINLRRRFEEVMRQVQETRDDLVKHGTRLESLPNARGAEVAAIRTSIASCASRTLNSIRKNGNENRSIEAAFSDIVEELINNAIPPKSLAEQMGESIVAPLHELNEVDFPTVDTLLGSFKLAVERDAVTKEHINASVVAIDEMLAHMRVLLDEIKDLAELHEIVKDLKQLIDAQQNLRDKTKALQKKKLIEKLKLLGGDDE